MIGSDTEGSVFYSETLPVLSHADLIGADLSCALQAMPGPPRHAEPEPRFLDGLAAILDPRAALFSGLHLPFFFLTIVRTRLARRRLKPGHFRPLRASFR
jgi:hypothetical protein